MRLRSGGISILSGSPVPTDRRRRQDQWHGPSARQENSGRSLLLAGKLRIVDVCMLLAQGCESIGLPAGRHLPDEIALVVMNLCGRNIVTMYRFYWPYFSGTAVLPCIIGVSPRANVRKVPPCHCPNPLVRASSRIEDRSPSAAICAGTACSNSKAG